METTAWRGLVAWVAFGALHVACSAAPTGAHRSTEAERGAPSFDVDARVMPSATTFDSATVPVLPAVSAAPQVAAAEPLPLFHGTASAVATGGSYFHADERCADMPGSLPSASWRDTRAAMVLPSRLAQRKIAAPARRIVGALKAARYADVATLVHQTKGVCLRAAKGSACITLTRAEFAACSASKRFDWPVDNGSDEPHKGTCHEAMRAIFMARDFSKSDASYNCFPGLRGNNGAPILHDDLLTQAYATFFADEIDPSEGGRGFQPWRALWLGFVIENDQPLLVEVVSEYWGI